MGHAVPVQFFRQPRAGGSGARLCAVAAEADGQPVRKGKGELAATLLSVSSNVAIRASRLVREAAAISWRLSWRNIGLFTHQSMPISLALSTEQMTSRIWIESSSMSTSFTLISPAIDRKSVV